MGRLELVDKWVSLESPEGVKVAVEPSQSTNAQTTSGDPSRRSFLVKLSLGVAALAGISMGALRFGGKNASASTQDFPGPDSIFHPAKDPRQDPRRR